MKGRIPANSASLKINFPKVYQELFSKCPIVVSAPGSFWWTGEYATENGGIAIIQKIPLRTYVGIEPTNPGIVKFGTYTFYLPSKKKFVPALLEESISTKLLTLIKELPQTQAKGLIIHILIETSPGCGLNTSGALSSSLACAINLFFEKIPPAEITSWSKMETTTKINNEMFNNVFRLAWKFECVPHADAATGATVFVPFFPGSYPVAFWSTPLHWNFDKRAWQTHYSFVDKAQYFGMRIDELFDFADQPSWPIDFALIYSGEPRTTTLTVNSARENIEELAQIHQNLSIVDKKLKNVDFLPPIYHLIKSSKGTRMLDTFWDTLTNPIALNSLEILFGFKGIFERGLSQETLRTFFKHINRNQDLLSALGLSSPIVDLISQSLKNEIKELGDNYGAATKITGGGIRGDILFTCVYHGLRNQMDKVISKTKKEIGEDIFLDYASWLDGIEDEGVRVEQDLKSSVYSDFVSAGAVQIKAIPSEEFVISQLYTKEKFEKTKSKIDLLLDCVEEKILIKGEEISSKEIPSSKTTIKVLQLLVQNLSKETPSTAFGKGSYFEDRNEFQSKIISPLNKLLQKRLGKKLNITVTGGITEFTVKLSPSPFDIYLLERSF